MSDTEAEPIHLNLVFETIPDAQTLPTARTEGSRKRPADEPSADVPSVSRRRRANNSDSSQFVRPSFPSTCCVNGIVQPPMPACLLHPPPTFEGSGATSSSAGSLPPMYRPQVIAPQMRAQMAAMPSTSTVNNMAPVTFHMHSPPILLPPSYASPYVQVSQNRGNSYFPNSNAANTGGSTLRVVSHQPSTPHTTQPMLGLRLPTTPVPYASNIHPEQQTQRRTQYNEAVFQEISETYIRLMQLADPNNQWESAPSLRAVYPTQPHAYPLRDPNSRVEFLLSRVRQAAAQAAVQAAAQAAVDTTAQLIAAHQGRTFPDSQQHDGPVAIPTLTSEWTRRGNADHGNVPNFSQDLANIGSDIPFRTWEAAVLQIFDRMAPQMNLMRLPPKGMPKSEIEQLKSFRLMDPTVLMEKICVVCQCEFEKREHIRVLPCDHHYHMKCIDKWLKTNRTCPICRKSASESTEGATLPTVPPSVSSAPHAAVQVITQVNGSPVPPPASPSPGV